MKNPRLKGVVNIFGNKMGLEDSIPIRFQCFINYLLLKKIYFDINGVYPYESMLSMDFLSDIDFDKNTENGMAVDGCFAIHQRKILHLELDDEILDAQMRTICDGDLHIVLIQTKSGDLATNDISTLSDCLNMNFADQTKWEKFIAFKNKCENLIQNNYKVNIQFHVFYISGNDIDLNLFNNETFKVRENALKDSMKKFFWIDQDENISISYFDEGKIYQEYTIQEEYSREVDAVLVFDQITDNISCAEYGNVRLGIISIAEIMKILVNQSNNRPNELYDYNVRDHIDKSGVNEKIEKTLSHEKDLFLLLNNGLTIVVSEQERKGDKGVFLKNIRIVNGCQTSHAIMNVCKDNIDCLDARISVKIIKTEMDDILGKITYSSNCQNPVHKDNLFAIEPKIFALEKAYKDFFISYPATKFRAVKLERRQGQISNSDDYIDMMAQAKAFTSLWSIIPNIALMYADEPLDDFKKCLEQNDFIAKSLFSGIIWNTVIKDLSISYYNGRYQIYSCVALKIIEEKLHINVMDKAALQRISDDNLQKIICEYEGNIHDEIILVCKAIDNLNSDFPKTKSGKIHYRKFYMANALQKIYNEYTVLKNNADTTTES